MLTGRIAWLATVVVVAGCGQGPTSPRTVALNLAVGNTGSPPSITSIAVPATRREAGTDIAVSAVVQDDGSPLAQLSYEWVANAGVITGNGPIATFRLAPGIQKGLDVLVTLTVVKRYTKGTEYRVVRQAAPFRVHDSVAELKELGRRFLIDLFGHSEIPPAGCLVDFSANGPCRQGRDAELQDLIDHRQNYVVLDRRLNSQQVILTGPDSALINNDAYFFDRFIPTGKEAPTSGNFPLTAVYEAQRWWLCSSGFDDSLQGDGGIATIKRMRGRRGVIRK